MRRTKRKMENLKTEKKNEKKKEAGERGGTKREREKRSQGEGEFNPRKWAREMKNERKGDLKKI